MRREITFIGQHTIPRDWVTLDLHLEDEVVEIQEGWLMSHVMHKAGVFPSVSQARKNGWNKPIPTGFHMFVVGKLKNVICIWNPIAH